MARSTERRAGGGDPGRRGCAGGSARVASALAAAALAGALAAPAALAADSPRDDVAGTYRIRGTARVEAAAPLGRSIDSRGDAVVRAGGGRTVRLRLASMGH